METDTDVTYYWAPWCSSCGTVGPMLEALCKAKGVRLHKINVDAHATPLPPNLSSYTALPIVLIERGDGESVFAGGSVTARVMSDHIY